MQYGWTYLISESMWLVFCDANNLTSGISFFLFFFFVEKDKSKQRLSQITDGKLKTEYWHLTISYWQMNLYNILLSFFSYPVLTSEGIVFITDFSYSKPPGSAGKKVYIASPHASPAHTKPAPATAPAPTGAKKALNKVKVLITNEKPTWVKLN